MRLLMIVPVFALALLADSLPAQTSTSPFATIVYSYKPGLGTGTFNDPSKALGAPKGAGASSGSFDVVTLGVGGSLTLGFAAPIMDGPGADFIVFENGFYVGQTLRCFAEVFFVEVSSNGKDFARFPVSYVGPNASGPFAAFLVGSWRGLGGTTPVLAHSVLRPGIDARDAARAGGDAFDLSDLKQHPLVKAQKLNLHRITHLRLVDLVDGTVRDQANRLIRDPSAGSADVDAVAVLNFLGHQDPKAPQAQLELTKSRRLRLRLRDTEGILDLDPAKLHMSIQGIPLDFWGFVSQCRVVQGDAKGFTLETLFSLPKDLPVKLSLCVRDKAGRIASDSVVLH
ncbi:MAG: hypothetical protein CSA62_12890 [Planctomycetota bacterium]|nr:MAG: hypothetical protein CSA62_12890 [Planctomycetota bacterium]